MEIIITKSTHFRTLDTSGIPYSSIHSLYLNSRSPKSLDFPFSLIIPFFLSLLLSPGLKRLSNTHLYYIKRLCWLGFSAKLLQSCPTLCDPMDCGPPGSSVPGILPARILEWVAMPSSKGSSQPLDGTCIFYVSCTGRHVLYH